MATLKDISIQARWEIASRILTYMPFLFLEGLAEPYDKDAGERMDAVFRDIAQELRRIADEYDMPRDDAAGLVQTLGTLSVVLFGSGFETPLIEGVPEETVIRFTACPMCTLARERGLREEDAGVLCASYVPAVIEALNPEYRVEVHDAMCRGSLFCEMVILRRQA